MLNRAVLIVRPKQPFLDWAAQLDDSGLVPNVEGEQTVYLIPQFDDDDEGQKVLHRVFAEVFERELFGWHTDERATNQGIVGSNPAGRAKNHLATKTRFSSLLWDLCGTSYPPVPADASRFMQLARKTKFSS